MNDPLVLSKPLSLSWHNTNIPERPGPESLNIFCIFAVTKSYQIKLCQTSLERYLMFEMHLWQIPSRSMNLQRVNLKQILNLTRSPAMRSYHQFQEKNFMFSTMQKCVNVQQKHVFMSFKAFDESVQMINERQDILPNRWWNDKILI